MKSKQNATPSSPTEDSTGYQTHIAGGRPVSGSESSSDRHRPKISAAMRKLNVLKRIRCRSKPTRLRLASSAWLLTMIPSTNARLRQNTAPIGRWK